MGQAGHGEIPLEPFREAFLQSGLTVSEMARRMGYVREMPNIDRTRRALVLRPDTDSRVGRRVQPRQTITYRTAKRLCDALDLDYADMGV